LCIITAPSCTTRPSGRPVHTHIVCMSEEAGCGPAERLDAFSEWLGKDAVNNPGSSFRVTFVSGDGRGARLVFVTCIPPRWPSSVLAEKRELIATARARLG